MMMCAETGVNGSDASIWEQIDLSESYLVSCWFEKAESLASSILKQLCSVEVEDEVRDNMLECASMVLIQSIHLLHRSSEILDELKQWYPSLEYIPANVVFTGACLQVLGSSSGAREGAREFLHEFLGKWRFVDGGCYMCDADERLAVEVDEYLKVVELYVMKCLVPDLDVAISWVEKAQLPEEARQELLRRLHSLHSTKVTASSETDNTKARSSDLEDVNLLKGDENHDLKGKQQAVLRLSKRLEPCFWWFRTMHLKFGNAQVKVSNWKIGVGCLGLILCWIIRHKRDSLKRVVKRQALNLKKAVIDSWQLAFSYQMNPLAAVQPSMAQSRLR